MVLVCRRACTRRVKFETRRMENDARTARLNKIQQNACTYRPTKSVPQSDRDRHEWANAAAADQPWEAAVAAAAGRAWMAAARASTAAAVASTAAGWASTADAAAAAAEEAWIVLRRKTADVADADAAAIAQSCAATAVAAADVVAANDAWAAVAAVVVEVDRRYCLDDSAAFLLRFSLKCKNTKATIIDAKDSKRCVSVLSNTKL